MTTNDSAEQRNLPLLITMGAVGLLVLISLIVIFTRGAAPAVDPASPEGVTQRFAQAVIDDDHAAAQALLAPPLSNECTPVSPDVDRGMTVSLVRSDVNGDKATVFVDFIVSESGGLFGPNDYVARDTFNLERVDGVWGIVSPPWRMVICEEMWK